MNPSSPTTDVDEAAVGAAIDEAGLLVAMLLRREEYSAGAHGHAEVQRVAA